MARKNVLVLINIPCTSTGYFVKDTASDINSSLLPAPVLAFDFQMFSRRCFLSPTLKQISLLGPSKSRGLSQVEISRNLWNQIAPSGIIKGARVMAQNRSEGCVQFARDLNLLAFCLHSLPRLLSKQFNGALIKDVVSTVRD